MSVTNTKTVGEFVAVIRGSLEKSNKAWGDIAAAFAEAREMFGSGSDSFKKLLKETKFSAATAHKLASIALSERLQAYKEKLVGVQSWGTLYAIHALTEEKFEKLKTEYKLDNASTVPPFITLSRVEAIRKGETPKSPLRLFATISIDEDALVGELIDDHYLQELEDTIAKMAASIPYVRVQKTNIIDNAQEELMRRTALKQQSITRKLFCNAIEGRLATRKKQKVQTNGQFELMVLGQSREELLELLSADPREAFAYLGVEYDETKIFDDAMTEASRVCEKRAEKAKKSGNPFRYSIVQNAGDFRKLKITTAEQLEIVRNEAKIGSLDSLPFEAEELDEAA
jgi:hypothetical protein